MLLLAGAMGFAWSTLGCAVGRTAGPITILGGSVLDFDRGFPATNDIDSGSPPGAPDTIGAGSIDVPYSRYPEGLASVPPPLTEPLPPPQRPPADVPQAEGSPAEGQPNGCPSGAIEDPVSLRAAQRALSQRGYYRGPISGVPNPDLTAALRRYQADRSLPITGQLDRQTASTLRVPVAAAARGAAPTGG